MKKKYFYTIILLAIVSLSSAIAQDREIVNYPKGIYDTFETYKNQIPSDTTTAFNFKVASDTIKYRFFNTDTEKRIRKAFAISDGEHLYVNSKHLYKHLNKTDYGKQMRDDGKFYLKAKHIGKHYHYYENYYTGSGAAIWGGAIAVAASRRIKGMVYDVVLEEFNIFRNAKDFNRFVAKNHKEYLENHP